MITTANGLSDGPSCDIAATGAADLSRRYPVWLCDVWGVIHNGVEAYPAALECLSRHRQAGGAVVLVTNAPRPSAAILPQLARLQVPPECYDHIVSSGDVTRALVEGLKGSRAHHLGPERDRGLLAGIAVDWVGIEAADAVVCSGLIDDETESPADYDAILAVMRSRDVEMICANPDKVVQKGSRLLPCAGALAERYQALGGTVRMAGKPFAPIYVEAMGLASRTLGRRLERNEVLAIGDGLDTDAEGARKNNLALLFISDGIHGGDMTGIDQHTTATAVRAAVPGVELVATMPALSWASQDCTETD